MKYSNISPKLLNTDNEEEAEQFSNMENHLTHLLYITGSMLVWNSTVLYKMVMKGQSSLGVIVV